MILTHGPGELHGMQAFVVPQHTIDQLKQLITLIKFLAWFLGSEVGVGITVIW